MGKVDLLICNLFIDLFHGIYGIISKSIARRLYVNLKTRYLHLIE